MFNVTRGEKHASELQVMMQRNVELTTTLKERQLRTDAMASAAEELYGKHITVCR